MKESLQLKLGSKVKMSLIQPKIMCGGRDEVTCKYRGKVSKVFDKEVIISFKYKGEKIDARFDVEKMEFTSSELKDIKIISVGQH